MAKFFGVVGFADDTTEKAAGVFTDDIVEYSYYGDVVRDSRQLTQDTQNVNNDLTVGVSISIVADEYAREHMFAMRYVRWSGSLWVVSNVDVQRPRLILRLGGVYNGPTAT